MMSMNLIVNGEPCSLEPTPVVPCLDNVVRALGHNPTLVVVEHNGVIVPKGRWQSTTVERGDNLEIVTIVGGGS